jgi:hypothetical protein
MAQYVSKHLTLPCTEQLEKGLAIADKLRMQTPRPQFPHSDYSGMMLDLAKTLNCLPDQTTISTHNIVVPSLFTSQSTKELKENASELDSLESDLQAFKSGKYVARAVLYALEGGKWTLEREIFDKVSKV